MRVEIGAVAGTLLDSLSEFGFGGQQFVVDDELRGAGGALTGQGGGRWRRRSQRLDCGDDGLPLPKEASAKQRGDQ